MIVKVLEINESLETQSADAESLDDDKSVEMGVAAACNRASSCSFLATSLR